MTGEIEDIFKKTYGTTHLKFKETINYDQDTYIYSENIINYILDNESTITTKSLQTYMTGLCRQYKLAKKPRFSTINYIIKKKIDIGEISEVQYYTLINFLATKKMRSQSGILQISIMTSGKEFSCAYDCYYCPNIKGMPRSYVPQGPSARRAIQLDFDTVDQFQERASVYAINGHPVDKIEVIVLGGTWDSYEVEYQREFITKVYYASNTFYELESRNMVSMEEEIAINETALCKIIGLTIETRPDQISKEQILRLLSYGVTRVQLGVQHTDNKILKGINRQCTIERVYESIYLLKEAGLKVQTHWMPNLPNSSPDKDREMFNELNYNPLLQSDDIKIYPTIVTKTSDKDEEEVYTEIEKWYRDGKYKPYSNRELHEVIIEGKANIHPYVRISRVFRDIPMPNILGGANEPNLRQILEKEMEDQGIICECIRCREVKDRIVDPKDIKIKVIKYDASYSDEYFISAESYDEKGLRVVHGFVRLRFPYTTNKKGWIDDLEDCALIREVHVYGQLVPTFCSSYIKNNQHKGLGRKLIKKAEQISINNGFPKIAITSGVGVRNYYKRLGYNKGEFYMVKDLNTLDDCPDDCPDDRIEDSIFTIIQLLMILFIVIMYIITAY